MIRAFLLSLGQLTDPAILRVFLKSIGLTLLIFVVLGAGLWFGTQWLFIDRLGWGEDATGFAILGEFVVTILFGWVLFRAIAIAVIDLFGDQIVVAVERKHYPEVLATARDVPFHRSLRMGLRSAGRALAVNLVLAPTYILLLLTGIGTPLLFFAANGWLLGVDLGEMVAARHMPPADIKAWRASTRWSRWEMGVIVSALLSVPIINLFAPILGAAMAAHLFHRRKA
jgi:CysZ protein